MNRGEFLQRLHPSEPQHRAFSSTDWPVRIFSPVVQPATHFAAVAVAQLSHRCRVGSQPICDDRLGATVPLQCLLQEPQCRGFVPFLSDVALQDITLVIDRTPQIMHLAVDLHVELAALAFGSSRCRRYCRKPRIRLIRWRRMSSANSGPKRFHHSRTVSWQTSMPRSTRRSSKFRRLSGNRT